MTISPGGRRRSLATPRGVAEAVMLAASQPVATFVGPSICRTWRSPAAAIVET
jgi:hypothetical protein